MLRSSAYAYEDYPCQYIDLAIPSWFTSYQRIFKEYYIYTIERLIGVKFKMVTFIFPWLSPKLKQLLMLLEKPPILFIVWFCCKYFESFVIIRGLDFIVVFAFSLNFFNKWSNICCSDFLKVSLGACWILQNIIFLENPKWVCHWKWRVRAT